MWKWWNYPRHQDTSKKDGTENALGTLCRRDKTFPNVTQLSQFARIGGSKQKSTANGMSDNSWQQLNDQKMLTITIRNHLHRPFGVRRRAITAYHIMYIHRSVDLFLSLLSNSLQRVNHFALTNVCNFSIAFCAIMAKYARQKCALPWQKCRIDCSVCTETLHWNHTEIALKSQYRTAEPVKVVADNLG